jgi:hypothetical protein
MSGPGVPDDDMPIFPHSAQSGFPPMQDTDLSALLEGTELPADGAAGLQAVAEILAALRTRPADDELAGEMTALVQFRQRVSVSAQPHTSRRRRPTLLTALLSAKAAAIAAVVAASAGGIATAAFAGDLPAQVQRIAHETIGAPAPAADAAGAHSSGSSAPASHQLSQHSLFGLCTAYEHANSMALRRSVAFRALAKKAGGSGKVAAFCAAVPHPGGSPSPAPGPTSHPTGKPTSHPTPHSHPTGKPTSHPTGKPASHT